MVFYLLNALSYISGENYDTLTELISYWLTGDVFNDVKSAIYCHMRELFARNMHQQEILTQELKRLLEEQTLKEINKPSTISSLKSSKVVLPSLK